MSHDATATNMASGTTPLRPESGFTKKSTRLIRSLEEWSSIRNDLKSAKHSVGFVPTMGALHSGHASLLQRSRHENTISVLSIYVNPTQFNNQDDLLKYPSTLEHDTRVAEEAEVDYILLPTYPQIYPDHYRYKLTESELSLKLCGAHRPGHFDGVLTVVMKLFNLVQPDRAYFGEKDHQQLELVRGMVEAFFLSVDVIGCPTHREADGLAMSSRNVRLTQIERERAPQFAQILRQAATAMDARLELQKSGFEVDYVEEIGTRRYGAVNLGAVRLIDNVER